MKGAAVPSRFLELGALAALEHLRFGTRQRIEGSYSGRHRSRQRGGAGEFVDYREYSDGEDLRRLDWKVLARTGRHYVRLYQDETNLVCTVAIDASGSMLFGPRRPPQRPRSWLRLDPPQSPARSSWLGSAAAGSKLEYVQLLTTALSYLIGKQRDQVGLAVIANGLVEHIPPGSTSDHIARIHGSIEGLATRPATDLAGGLRTLFERLRQRGVLLCASDFLVDDLEPVFAALRLFRHRQYEVVVMHIVHPDEERLPEGLAYRFEGMENDGTMDCSPADIRSEYTRRFEAHAAMVRALSLAAGCDYRRVSTAVPYLQTLGTFLVEREG